MDGFLKLSSIFIGCGSSEEDTTPSVNQIDKVSYIGGRAVDGYLLGSTACLD